MRVRFYRTPVCTIALVASAVRCADRAAPASATPHVSAAIATVDTAGCELIPAVAHPDAEALVREFLRRDAAGEFTGTTGWFAGAVDCPGHEAAPNAATMARSPRLRVLSRGVDSLRAQVQWERISIGDAQVHDTEYDTLTAVRTRYGWRIRSPALNPHVPVPPAPAMPMKDPAAAT